MQLSINVPALFFPAISLSMLAYNARYLAIAALIRNLHKEYENSHENKVYKQIKVLNQRLNRIILTQGFAIFSFIGCIVTMFLIYLDFDQLSHIIFIISLIAMTTSLVILFSEILVSKKALRILLKDMEE